MQSIPHNLQTIVNRIALSILIHVAIGVFDSRRTSSIPSSSTDGSPQKAVKHKIHYSSSEESDDDHLVPFKRRKLPAYISLSKHTEETKTPPPNRPTSTTSSEQLAGRKCLSVLNI